MDKLVTSQEIQALVGLLSKATLSPAEVLWAQQFTTRLMNYAQMPEKPPEVKPEEMSRDAT